MITTLVRPQYHLRSVAPDDRAGLTRFYGGLSRDSIAARFHGSAPTIPEATATFFCRPDHEHREGIVAESFDASGEPTIIGHVCIEPIDRDVAEVAIAVADTWQHHGVGRAMLGRAIAWAQSHDIARLAASTQCSNAAMIALLRSMDHPITFGASGDGTVDVYLDLSSSRPIAA